MKVFMDTSAFAKRYVAEPGSEQMLELCEEADDLVVSILCLPEFIATLCRLVREKKLVKADYRKLKGAAAADLRDADVCQITPEVLDAAVPLLEQHSLRCADALHVACALAVEPDLFVSADHRQLAAARKAGLKVVDAS